MDRETLIRFLIIGLIATTAIGCNSLSGCGETMKIGTQSPLSGVRATIGDTVKDLKAK